MLKLHLIDQHKVVSLFVLPFMCLLVALFILAIASATRLFFLLLLQPSLIHTVSRQHPAQFLKQALLAKLQCKIY